MRSTIVHARGLSRGLFAATVIVSATAGVASAAPFYARGDFNGWTTGNPLADLGSGHYTTTITGLTPGNGYEYKIAEEDFDPAFPGSNGKVIADADGEITFHFYEGTFSDGYEPAANRVGYEDPGHGWDIIGSFNGWSEDSDIDLTNVGNGVYTTDLVVPTAGNYAFKFRKDEDWGISIGDNFGNSAADATFSTTTDNEFVRFTLDLPNGRWDVSVVPEPASLGVLAMGGLLLRRKR